MAIKKKAGFTLVELLIVIAIIGIITALSVPGIIEWLKIRRIHDSAISLASTLENVKAYAGKMRRPMVVAYVDNNHFATYTFTGTYAPEFLQPSSYSNYSGPGATDPQGSGSKLRNPMATRVNMSRWQGQFSSNIVPAIIIQPNGAMEKFQGGIFSGITEPLGDIYEATFTDNVIQVEGPPELKTVTTWKVVIYPAGTVNVRRLDKEES
ncbi:MAG: prepilin-type N-terminal cleavage/methylation domain-containing protein [Acidobacteria bacterium]|nr:prepilin-type N-terminal cleavage/methylation domain-containing protein [Acidobacteriota bacterium]